jgi:hypothetical protein
VLQFYTEGYAALLVSIALALPSFDEADGVLTMRETPRSGIIAADGDAALALFRNGRDDVVISGLTCGTDPTTSDFVMSEAMLHMLAGKKFTLSQAEIAM